MKFADLFKPRYTPYEFSHFAYEVVAETMQVEDTRYSHGYGISDPLDVKSVPTGQYYALGYEIYVKRHLKNNLPKYKSIRRQDLDKGPFQTIEGVHGYIKLKTNA